MDLTTWQSSDLRGPSRWASLSRWAGWQALIGTALVTGYLLSAYYVVHKVIPLHLHGDMNVYLAQPLIWSGLAVLAFVLWQRQADRPGFSRAVFGLAVVAGAFQLSALVIAGVLYGFGHSPHAGQAVNMAKNGLYLATLLLGFEMARSYLLVVWGRVNSIAAFVLVAMLFTAVAIAPGQYAFSGGTERSFEVAGRQFMPTASESVLATFFASIGGPLPAFACRMALAGFEWFSPALPNLNWSIRAFVGTLAPALAMLIVWDIHLSGRSDQEKEADREDRSLAVSPLWMLAAMVAVGILWLNTGLFGISPSLVSGHSMSPAFETGDVVITREVAPEHLQVGDVVRFRSGTIPVMPRIIEIGDTPQGPVFVTQGDSNNAPDSPILAGQIEGEVVLVIPEAGWPLVYAGKLLRTLF